MLSRSLASPLRRKEVREEDVSGGLTSRPGEEGEQCFHEPWSSRVPVGFELSVCERERKIKRGKEIEKNKSQGEEREREKRGQFSDFSLPSFIFIGWTLRPDINQYIDIYTFILPVYVKYQLSQIH